MNWNFSIPQLTGNLVTFVFNLLTHVIIVFGMFAMFKFIWYMIKEEPVKLEKVIRTISAVTGFLIYFGALATGVSIPDFMMSSVSSNSKWAFGLLGIMLPLLVGGGIGWYIVLALKRGEEIAGRVIILIATFILTMFTDVYASTFQVDRPDGTFSQALIPNLTFTVGITLYVIFKYTPDKKRPQEKDPITSL